MPLIKRDIEPKELSRGVIDKKIRNELECVTNNTLSHIIRQLSSLSKHAEDMFGELFNDSNRIFMRTVQLSDRINNLKIKVTQLDSSEEEVSLQDINTRKPFRSSTPFDQQVVARISLPISIADKYQNADPPPALGELNQFREDGKDSMKFYTDPTYFFELWFQEIQKETQAKKREYKEKRLEIRRAVQQDSKRPKTNRQKVKEVQSRKQLWDQQSKGKEFVEETQHTPTKAQENDHHHNQQQQRIHRQSSNRPSSLELALDHSNVANNIATYPNQNDINAQQHIVPYAQQNDVYPSQYKQANGPVDGHYRESQYKDGHVANHEPYDNRAGRRQSETTRPHQAPPAPPPINQSPLSSSPSHRMSRQRADSRVNLPPPPPPPPGMQSNGTVSGGAPLQRVSHYNKMAPSPGTPDMNDLPPPPSPPMFDGTSGSIESIPPPPPINSMAPPLPPPPPPVGEFKKTMVNGNIPVAPPPPVSMDNLSLSSESSITTTASNTTSKPPEPVVDARNDLLGAIRKGFHLKKVEKMKEEKKKSISGVLDVQSIMDKALEIRRKAMEAMDNDDDDDDDDDEEDDDDEWGDD